ncbi:endonuclease/exonuclease/phosphatase family protein [Paractinoplanes globisporus]|uniref:Endonuclease/exonuclease/phosphatase family protein n=1 Tax=Paractinoplanes globisporus TaxID=113565 RepID=A0ABW6WDS0_9ACTN|nr:endonuclease/exonuclease/phosphatase family protein [Actinoplanes globisporus]
MSMRPMILTALAIAVVYAIGGDVGAPPPRARLVRQASIPHPPATAMDALAGPPTLADLDVMTFNLRYAGDTAPNSWAQRRPVMRALLTKERPDLIGTQEGLPAQLRDIRSDLGAGYAYIGMGRDGGDAGEHMAIFFDKARLLPLESGNFWLSETPAVPGSVSWGAGHTRMVTWVLFADLATGRHFYAVNTHLDNVSENARRHGAALLRERLRAFESLPVVLTGDFNSPAEPGGWVYHLLTDRTGLADAWLDAQRRGPAYATIHNYRGLVPGGERDDWILTTPGITTMAAMMNTHSHQGQFPSDHLPVQARLRLP